MAGLWFSCTKGSLCRLLYGLKGKVLNCCLCHFPYVFSLCSALRSQRRNLRLQDAANGVWSSCSGCIDTGERIDLFFLWQVPFKCMCLHMGVLLMLSLKCCAFISLVLFCFYFSRRSMARKESIKFSLWLPSRVVDKGVVISTPDLCSINLHLQQCLLCFTSEDCVYVRLWDLFVQRSGKHQCCEFLFCWRTFKWSNNDCLKVRQSVPFFSLTTVYRGSCRLWAVWL